MDNVKDSITVSVIVPAYNCAEFIHECLTSIINQHFDEVLVQQQLDDEFKLLGGETETQQQPAIAVKKITIEISIYEDASKDLTFEVIQKWLYEHGCRHLEEDYSSEQSFSTYNNEEHVINFVLEKPSHENILFTTKLRRNLGPSPRGVGFARNRAIEQSTGGYLCFCDSDDIMMPNRIVDQLKVAILNPSALIGTKFIRLPLNSMETLTKWGNSLNSSQLYTQIFSSFGPTLIMPTWFCNRKVYENISGQSGGGFSEKGYGIPEDLIFFYKHLDNNGKLIRIDHNNGEPLMIYRHHSAATTFSVSTETIWNLRIERLQIQILSNWKSFTIWNAGKLGRKLFRSLNTENQNKVFCFCDVDEKKISKHFYQPFPIQNKIPIIHFREAKPPFIICVKTELTFENEAGEKINSSSKSTTMIDNSSSSNSSFLSNLQSLNLVEGVDYFYFN